MSLLTLVVIFVEAPLSESTVQEVGVAKIDWAIVIAIISLCLSIAIWARSIYQQHVNMNISNIVSTCIQYPVINPSIYLSLCISNNSYNPLSVTSIELLLENGVHIWANREEQLYLGAASNKVNTERSKIWSTPLPLNLSPHESSDVLLSFSLTQEELVKSNFPVTYNFLYTNPDNGRKRLNELGPTRAIEKDMDPLPVELHFHATRKIIKFRKETKFADPDAQQELLIRKLDIETGPH